MSTKLPSLAALLLLACITMVGAQTKDNNARKEGLRRLNKTTDTLRRISRGNKEEEVSERVEIAVERAMASVTQALHQLEKLEALEELNEIDFEALHELEDLDIDIDVDVDIDTPEIEIPEIDVEVVEIPEIEIPEVDIEVIEIPEIEIDEADHLEDIEDQDDSESEEKEVITETEKKTEKRREERTDRKRVYRKKPASAEENKRAKGLKKIN